MHVRSRSLVAQVAGVWFGYLRYLISGMGDELTMRCDAIVMMRIRDEDGTGSHAKPGKST
jgi:hypothetical protein